MDSIVLFDSINGRCVPYDGFGDIINGREREEVDLFVKQRTVEAVSRIKDIFNINLYEDAEHIVGNIEQIIAEMWNTGWSPDNGNINLFSTDFGLVLTDSILRYYGGVKVFRSKTNLIHLSVYWSASKIEVFPIHKMYKRLSNDSGENILSFVKGLKNFL